MKDSTPEVVFQKVKANIPDDLKGPLVTFYFIKPWFFIREDLFFECWRKNWLQEKFGVSRWRLFRAIFLRKKQSFKLPAICEYIFFKHGAVRYFDLNADICFKVLLQKKTKERSLWLKEIEGRNLFSKHVLTLQVLDQGHNFIVEPIARGVRVLNSKYLISLYVKRRDYIFNNLVQFFRMSNNDIVRQFICCEEIYLSRHGEVEYVRYGSDIVDKKLSLLRGFIDK
jgi:hypothetical protein